MVNRYAKFQNVVVLGEMDDRKIDDRKMGEVLVNRFGEFRNAVVSGGFWGRSFLSSLARRVGVGLRMKFSEEGR